MSKVKKKLIRMILIELHLAHISFFLFAYICSVFFFYVKVSNRLNIKKKKTHKSVLVWYLGMTCCNNWLLRFGIESPELAGSNPNV